MESIIKNCSELYSDKEALNQIRFNLISKPIVLIIFGLIGIIVTKYKPEFNNVLWVKFATIFLSLVGFYIMVEYKHLSNKLQKLQQAYILNFIPFGRKQRMEKIKEQIAINKKNRDLIKRNKFIDSEKFKNINKHNIKNWVDKHVGKEKSIHNLFNQRVVGSDVIKMGLIYWSQLIPRKKLNLDQLRVILLTNQITEQDVLCLESVDVENLFSNYSNEDIYLLFTSGYKLDTYVKILIKSKQLDNLALEVKKDMMELELWVNQTLRAKESKEFYLPRDKEWIDHLEAATLESGRFVYLDSLVMIERWGKRMNNCLKDPVLRIKGQYIFGVIKDDKPYIMIALDRKGRIVEVKKGINEPLSAEEMELIVRDVASIC